MAWHFHCVKQALEKMDGRRWVLGVAEGGKGGAPVMTMTAARKHLVLQCARWWRTLDIVWEPMAVSEGLQEEPDLGYEWRYWHKDCPELESDDVAEVGVWRNRTTAAGCKERMRAVTDHQTQLTDDG